VQRGYGASNPPVEEAGREPMKDDVHSFAPFAAILLEGGNVAEFLDFFRCATGLDLAFHDTLNRKLWVSAQSESFREATKIYPLREVLRLYRTMEIRIGDLSAGILVLNVPNDGRDRVGNIPGRLLENLRIALTLHTERLLSRRQTELGQRDEFLLDLLNGRVPDAEKALEKARSFGWDLGGTIFVVIVRVSDGRGKSADPLSVQAVVQLTRARLKAFFPRTVYTVTTQCLVFIVPLSSEDSPGGRVRENISSFAASLGDEFSREFGLSVSVAAGGRARDVTEVSRSHGEALYAAAVQSAVFPGERAIFWDSLGEYRLLSLMSRTPEAGRLCADLLGPLLDDMVSSASDLLETLRMLDACNWNVRAVSEKMCFHYNTIKYRYARLREILGIDPDDAASRFRVGLALRLLDLIPEKDGFVNK
jgi:purine catabolism regulator